MGEGIKDTPIRAMLDVIERIPPRRFGTEKARILRRLVLIVIAKFANPDGAGSYPSVDTLAYLCGVDPTAVRRTIRWLVKKGLLKVSYQTSPKGTNEYAIVFSKCKHYTEDKAYLGIQSKSKQQALTRQRAHRRKSYHGNATPVTCHGNETPACHGQFENCHGHLESCHGQMEACHGNDSPANRPSDRSLLDRPALPAKGAGQRAPSSPSSSLSRLSSNDAETLNPPDGDVVGKVPFLKSAASEAVPTPEESKTPTAKSKDLVGCTSNPTGEALSTNRTTRHESEGSNAWLGFRADVSECFQREDLPISATESHWQAAIKVAQEYGSEVFLGALELWLDYLSRNDKADIVIGSDINPMTGRENKKYKTWLLNEFLNGGGGQSALRKAVPYQGRARGSALEFLVRSEISPESVTPACYDALRWIESRNLRCVLDSLHFDAGRETFGEFLAAFPEPREYNIAREPQKGVWHEKVRSEFQECANRILTEAAGLRLSSKALACPETGRPAEVSQPNLPSQPAGTSDLAA